MQVRLTVATFPPFQGLHYWAPANYAQNFTYYANWPWFNLYPVESLLQSKDYLHKHTIKKKNFRNSPWSHYSSCIYSVYKIVAITIIKLFPDLGCSSISYFHIPDTHTIIYHVASAVDKYIYRNLSFYSLFCV